MSASRLYHVIHETVYHYAAPVTLSQHLLHLTPRNYDYQHVLRNSIELSPESTESEQGTDWFGNTLHWLAIRRPHDSLRLIAASTVDVLDRPLMQRNAPGPAWDVVAAQLAAFPCDAPLGAQECVMPSLHVPLLEDVRKWAQASFPPGRALLEATRHLMQRIHEEFKFDPEASTIATPVSTTFKQKRGVCQDFAHLMLCALRSLGLAARYMSGYILTHPAQGKPRLIGADASHAWVSVWCPDLGWVDFDPTNRQQPRLEHVVLGWGRDFADVSPMRGVILGGASHEVDVHVTVMPAELRSFAALLEEVRKRPRE